MSDNISSDFGIQNGALALGFMNQNFANVSTFNQNSFSGATRFLGHQLSPLVQSSANLTDTVSSQIPTIVNDNYQLQNSVIQGEFSPAFLNYETNQTQMQYGLQSQAINANEQVGLASANANANAGSSYLCTALIEHEGKSEDCEDMQTMKRFMFGYMMRREQRKDLIRYHQEAPDLVEKIQHNEKKDLIFHTVRTLYIDRFIRFIKVGDDERALDTYKQCLLYCGSMVGVEIHV